MPKIDITLPVKLTSPNVQEHWSKKSKRNKIYFLLLKRSFMTNTIPITLPCSVFLIRKGKRLLDDDNLMFAFKGIRDTICQLITGKPRGHGDNDPGFTWMYGQEISKKYEVYIEITW